MLGLKALIFVLIISAIVFRFGKPVALRFMSEDDYRRRRNVWVALSILGFLSPSFWLFLPIAVPILIWSARRDSNPIALYLFLFHAIPSVPITIPVFGISALFDLDFYRVLALLVLIPAALRLRRSTEPNPTRGLTIMDGLLLGYGLVYICLFVPPDLPNHVILPDSFTNVVRRTFFFVMDVYVLYFVASRSCRTVSALRDALASYCFGAALLAAVAVFESQKHWLLYTDFIDRWAQAGGYYLMRNGVVRAQAATGHAIALGYMLTVALGFWLYLKSHVESRAARIGVPALLWLGLVATYSRGPWLGAVAAYFVFAMVSPSAVTRLFKGAVLAAILAAAVYVSPLGDRIASALPFMNSSASSANSETILYRQRLWHRSWVLITEHPFFGDQLAYQKMEDLRQGEGIIDLVNAYAEVALFYGFVGLGLLFGLTLVGMRKAYKAARRAARSDPDFALMGASFVACIVGSLVMLATCSLIMSCEKVYYIVAGLTAAYIKLSQAPQPQTETRAHSETLAQAR